MRERGSEIIPAQSAKGEERGDRERNPWLAKMVLHYLLLPVEMFFILIIVRCFNFVVAGLTLSTAACRIVLDFNFRDLFFYILVVGAASGNESFLSIPTETGDPR